MATLPTFPTFTSSAPSIATLNELSGAVAFTTMLPIRVEIHFGASPFSVTQSISGATWTAVNWSQTAQVDTDGMHSASVNNTRLTCQTQGYYRLHTNIAMDLKGSNENYGVRFQQTTGSNNPAGSGHTVVFGGEIHESSAASPTNDFLQAESISTRSLTPCLYIGDYIEVYAYCLTATSIISGFGSFGTDVNFNSWAASSLFAYYVSGGP